ncbi:MAG: hypothetical protein GW760_01555 [Legionella sp.]|jgi:hypothetical protein|nr:hypothetical protein [Legionella sp.]
MNKKKETLNRLGPNSVISLTTANVITSSESMELIVPRASQEQQEVFFEHIQCMMQGIEYGCHQSNNNLMNGDHADYMITFLSVDRSQKKLLAQVISIAFNPLINNPMIKKYDEKQDVVELRFNTSSAESSHTLFTVDGRKKAYNTLAKRMKDVILKELDQYANSITINRRDLDVIRKEVQSQVEEYIVQFENEKDDYTVKNNALLNMDQLYTIFVKDLLEGPWALVGGGEKETQKQPIPESTPDIDWNLCFKILSSLSAVVGGAMLVVGLLLPVPGLAIAGACFLAVGVAGYAASQQDSEDEENDRGLSPTEEDSQALSLLFK